MRDADGTLLFRQTLVFLVKISTKCLVKVMFTTKAPELKRRRNKKRHITTGDGPSVLIGCNL